MSVISFSQDTWSSAVVYSKFGFLLPPREMSWLQERRRNSSCQATGNFLWPYWILYWRWTTEWLSGNRMTVRISIVYPRDYMADRKLPTLPLPSIARKYCPHIANPGKDQNSKLSVWFLLNTYCFHTTVKSKNHKWNHHKLGRTHKGL